MSLPSTDPALSQPLSQQRWSLDHDQFQQLLATTDNLLIIQDLDGVCMALVKDPLHRQIEPAYVQAVSQFSGHFYVLTNGEHIGHRGVNMVVERAFETPEVMAQQGYYLPGLAAGGVQWQDAQGQVSHPGVSTAELDFLDEVPQRMRARLSEFFEHHPSKLSGQALADCIDAAVLDNVASPTANLNTFHAALATEQRVYVALQQEMAALTAELLDDAQRRGLTESFFVHYAPNLGRDGDGKEILWYGSGAESGTTDFQFMLRGAVKEAGVVALLNRYYHQRYGTYPLGEGFNARQAPQSLEDLLRLVQDHFDPALMPMIVGVGDTVTSQVNLVNSHPQVQRGGSDRNFLQLIQNIGRQFQQNNLVVYIDSSGGELRNRRALKVETTADGESRVTAGPCDPADNRDPLTLNVVFPGGYQQYTARFQQAAQQRRHS
jgi:glucosylglycerol 3-phosphatase